MTIEFDHVFVLTECGAPQASSLLALGMLEGTPNTHAGQGTANRRFYFEDAMLELLYLRDLAEAKNGPGASLRLDERLAGESASPIGIVMRAIPGTAAPLFPGWRYRPDYGDPLQPFLVGNNSDLLEEPLCIIRPGNADSDSRQARSGNPFSRVTELRVCVPVTDPSPALRAVARMDRISLILGRPHCAELTFQQGEAGQSADLRPALPLVLRW